jgi:hypothetical protein
VNSHLGMFKGVFVLMIERPNEMLGCLDCMSFSIYLEIAIKHSNCDDGRDEYTPKRFGLFNYKW